MPSPTVKFIATEKTDNKRSNWESDLSGHLQTVKNVWSRDMSDWEEDTLYGSVITGDMISLDSSTRNDIENQHLSSLKNSVEQKVDTSTTDSVMVFDDHNYQGFDGVAQLGRDHDDADIRVGLCGGGGGFTDVIALHETLHTFDAQHQNNLQFDLAGSTVMGAGNYNGCSNGNNLFGGPITEINTREDLCEYHLPTDVKVAAWIDLNL